MFFGWRQGEMLIFFKGLLYPNSDIKKPLGCRRKGTQWSNLHSREPEERKTQCSVLHVCRTLLPEGVRTHLQPCMDYPGFVQVQETSRATHLLTSSLAIRNWRVGNE